MSINNGIVFLVIFMEFKRARNDSQVGQRRQEILDACKELLLKNGYEDTTLLDVSKLISVGRTTIYNYFPTKEDMFLELCVDECKSIVKEIDDLYDKASKDDPEKSFYDMTVTLLKKYKYLFQYYAIYVAKVFGKAAKNSIEDFKENVSTPFRDAYGKWLKLVNPDITEDKIKLYSDMLFVFYSGIHNLCHDDIAYTNACEAFARATVLLIKNK